MKKKVVIIIILCMLFFKIDIVNVEAKTNIYNDISSYGLILTVADSSEETEGEEKIHSEDEYIERSCDGMFTPEALEIIRYLIKCIRIMAPIVLIVFMASDFALATILNDQEALKKSTGKALKRAIALIGFFMVPTLIDILLGLPGINDYLTSLNIGTDWFCANAVGTEANPLPDDYWTIGYNPETGFAGGTFNFTQEISGQQLNMSLSQALARKGNSVADLNACIKNMVMQYGPGTRSGAAAAAVGLLQCTMELTGGYVIKYSHRGGAASTPILNGKLGVNPQWGDGYNGLNCATSSRWALCNGGMNACSPFSGETYASMTQNTRWSPQTVILGGRTGGTFPGGNVYSANVGDLLHTYNPGQENGHAMIIVGKDDNGYYIAENGRNTRLITYSNILDGRPVVNGVRRIYTFSILDDFYNNPANVNGLY